MQYILTQQEYDALTPVKRLQEANEALEKAKEVALQEANFTCIHDPSVTSPNRAMRGYCDDCPVSFKRVGYDASNLICVHPKHYSK